MSHFSETSSGPVVRPLRVFVTADPMLPVPPRLYGGIERVIALLIDGLMRRGHTVTLFAHPESTVACDLVPYTGGSGESWSETVAHGSIIAREAVRRSPDVIQSFGRLAYLLPLLPFPVPKVMSYQREVTPSTVTRALQLSRGTLSFTGCSQHLISPVAHIGRWHVVHNAVPTSTYRYAAGVAPDAPLVFLGRIEHFKGAHIAIEVARRAGRRLVIAGNVPESAEAQRYFREEVEPFVDGCRVSYVGPVDDAAKSTLLGAAAAFLMPVLWDEPFGIVMAEALACGTPVIGFGRGAVPEVVREGLTGFVSPTVDHMVEAIGRIGELNREACRQDAEKRFSQEALVRTYESIYAAVA